jgi:hypothetical protein
MQFGGLEALAGIVNKAISPLCWQVLNQVRPLVGGIGMLLCRHLRCSWLSRFSEDMRRPSSRDIKIRTAVVENRDAGARCGYLS